MHKNLSTARKTLRGVEIRERVRGAEHRYAYRVRFRNAHGELKSRTFDSAEDALDFRSRLRLLKRAGDLAELDAGIETLEQFFGDYWQLYAEVRLALSTRKKYRSLWNAHILEWTRLLHRTGASRPGADPGLVRGEAGVCNGSRICGYRCV